MERKLLCTLVAGIGLAAAGLVQAQTMTHKKGGLRHAGPVT